MKILRSTVLFLFIALAATAFFGCESTTGPDQVDGAVVSLSIQGTRPAAGSVAKAWSPWGAAQADSVVLPVKNAAGTDTLGTLTITTALIALKEIELESEEEQEEEEETGVEDQKLEFPGPFVVDLIANTVTPSLDTVTIDSGRYTQIELKLDKIEGDEDDDEGSQLVDPSDPLFGNSIYVEGLYSGVTATDRVTDVLFIMSYDIDEEFELTTVDPVTGVADSSVGFTAEEGEVNPIIIAFRLLKWFDFSNTETNEDGVDFTSLMVTQDTSGADIILLDENAEGVNEVIREVIEENIEESADYGEDKDGDGDLDSDEDDDPDEEDEDDH